MMRAMTRRDDQERPPAASDADARRRPPGEQTLVDHMDSTRASGESAPDRAAGLELLGEELTHIGQRASHVSTSAALDAAPRPLAKKLVTLTFDLPPAQVGETAMFKATSLGSMLTEGGIAQNGLDPRLGGQGGGSGVWEGNDAPDRRFNLGWTTLTTSEAGTEDYAKGFEIDRAKRSQEENHQRRTTGKLNAKWIGVTLRVLVADSELGELTWRPDPGSASGSGAWQTSQKISISEIDVRALTLMLSPSAYDRLQRHMADNENQVSLEFLDELFEAEYYVPSDWDPRVVERGPA